MKQKIIIITIITLILASTYLYFSKNNSIFDNDTQINLNNTEQINRFELKNDTVKITVAKENDKWITNDVYLADNKVVSKLFRLFKNIEIAILPPKDSIDLFKKKLKKYANKISFYKDEKLVAEYWVYKYNPLKKSTLLMNKSQNPIYARSTGLSSNISQYVSTNELLWRDKHIFGFDINKIKSLVYTNHKQKKSSFSIICVNKNTHKVLDYRQKEITFNPAKLSRYFSYFANIEFQSINSSLSEVQKDSIIQFNTFYSLKFDIENYGDFQLTLMGKPSKQNPSEFDMNFIYGRVNNERKIMNISYYSIDPIIKELSYFEK